MKKALLLVCLGFICSTQNTFAQNGACIPPVGVDCVTIPNFIDSATTTFAVSNFTNNGTDCNTQDQNYQYYQNKIASELPGGSFNLHVGLNQSLPAYLGVWVDWNNDLSFGSGEQVYLSANPLTTTNIAVNVPLSAVSDTLILRIRSGNISMGPCDSITAGETEDYRLIVLDPTGVLQAVSANDWTIYPNPANDLLSVDLGEISGTTKISVTDVLGNVVSAQVTGDRKNRIDLSALPRGVYFVSVNANGKSSVKKFVH